MAENNGRVFTFDSNEERRNCLFAVPKKGRLFEKCIKLLEGAGLDYNRVKTFFRVIAYFHLTKMRSIFCSRIV